jgi:hypothetical protein
MAAKEERDRWTEEALEVLKQHPEANPDVPSTETAAWRAGFVAGWIASHERLGRWLFLTGNKQSEPPEPSER